MPLMIIWLAIKGYSVAIIYKEAKNFSDDFYGSILRKFNVTPLKYKLDAALTITIIRALKEKKIILILNYQSYTGGVYLNLFGKSVQSAAGTAILAKRVGIPILPAYICRDEDNHNKITILLEISLQVENDLEKFV
jgi:KDO2-lipid IV(A) lauroyltransferase